MPETKLKFPQNTIKYALFAAVLIATNLITYSVTREISQCVSQNGKIVFEDLTFKCKTVGFWSKYGFGIKAPEKPVDKDFKDLGTKPPRK